MLSGLIVILNNSNKKQQEIHNVLLISLQIYETL